jgi:cold shock CspA family protein
MAKSKETFNKKEKEKKRIQKNKEKEEKREERKANSKKGQGLDDMIAYVDEFGNITDTPPDPAKRKKVKKEDILVSTPRQEEEEPEETTRTGVITFFNESKGYGFIRDAVSGDSVFVHINQATEPLRETDKVTYEVEMGPKGPNAIKVKITP